MGSSPIGRIGRYTMNTVIIIAKLLASLSNSSFEDEWVCWRDLRDKPQYVCEYSSPSTLYRVWSDDGQHFEIDLYDFTGKEQA